jgi:hypothetical protein
VTFEAVAVVVRVSKNGTVTDGDCEDTKGISWERCSGGAATVKAKESLTETSLATSAAFDVPADVNNRDDDDVTGTCTFDVTGTCKFGTDRADVRRGHLLILLMPDPDLAERRGTCPPELV